MDAQPRGFSTFLLVKNLECLFQVWPWTSDCEHQTPLALPPTPSPYILETSHQTQLSRVSWAPHIMCHIKWASQGQRWFWVLQVEQWPDKWRKKETLMKNFGCKKSNTGNVLESACVRERICVFVCVCVCRGHHFRHITEMREWNRWLDVKMLTTNSNVNIRQFVSGSLWPDPNFDQRNAAVYLYWCAIEVRCKMLFLLRKRSPRFVLTPHWP